MVPSTIINYQYSSSTAAVSRMSIMLMSMFAIIVDRAIKHLGKRNGTGSRSTSSSIIEPRSKFSTSTYTRDDDVIFVYREYSLNN